jgi:hypothetical protein
MICNVVGNVVQSCIGDKLRQCLVEFSRREIRIIQADRMDYGMVEET